MKTRRWFCSCLVVIVVLLLVSPLFGEPKRPRRQTAPPPPTPDIEATVISLRRLQYGTYVEVMREDGIYECININNDEGLEVRSGQRVAYSSRPTVHETSAFGMLRHGEDFRILTPQSDDRIYRRTDSDGTLIFTDNPSAEMNPNRAVPGDTKQTGKKK